MQKNVIAWTTFCIGALFVLTLVRYGIVYAEQRFWLDDLYTVSLIQSPDLKTLWRGIRLGLDGNPPEFLSLAFLATHYLPTSQVELILRTVNLVLTGIGFLALYRMSRRFAAPVVCLLAIMTIIAFIGGIRYSAFGLRAYPLYFSLDAICLLLLVRWIEAETALNWVLLTLGLTALSMTHTYAIAYVMAIAVGNAFAALVRGRRDNAIASLICAVPAVLLFLVWLPSIMSQLEVVRPYNWMTAPPLSAIAFNVLLLIVPIATIALAFKTLSCPEKPWRYWLDGLDFRVASFLTIAILEICFTIFVLVVSIAVYPVFTTRYLIPNLIIGFFILASILHLIQTNLPWRHALIGAAVTLSLIDIVVLAFTDPHRERAWRIPCLDAEQNTFLEDGVVTGGLPIVVEFPHAWFPRRRYEKGRYIFPLDWDVVERYPQKARNNAADFQVMRRFRDWAGIADIMTTSELIAAYPMFLVLQEDNRAWFENLNRTQGLEKQELASGGNCKLWRVTMKAHDNSVSIMNERTP